MSHTTVSLPRITVGLDLGDRYSRFYPHLLAPIRHRGAKAQADLAQLRSRDCLVRGRAQLINHVRGAVKSTGGRLPSASAPALLQ